MEGLAHLRQRRGDDGAVQIFHEKCHRNQNGDGCRFSNRLRHFLLCFLQLAPLNLETKSMDFGRRGQLDAASGREFIADTNTRGRSK